MLLDTSGLIVCLDSSDARHAEAESHFRAARAKVTHSYVLAEFVALAHTRKLSRAPSLGFAVGLIDNPAVDVLWVDEALHRRAMALLQRRLDKDYSLCDAVSFIIMRDRAETDALTTDRHFDQEGFKRLLSASATGE
jgi:predicted nucleic acid-binding protein